jgi:hypothetical protein
MKNTRLPRPPFRVWMTGSLAVVMASLCAARNGGIDDERLAHSMRVLRHSPFTVGETVARIEAAARLSGQAVLATLGDQARMIVLASATGGTPVMMSSADAQPDVPLRVQVRRAADGGADVLVAQALDSRWDELPGPVAEELAGLPAMLERALS